MKFINPDLGPDPLNQMVNRSARTRPMSRYERHKIFRAMATWELSNGRLSTWRRRQLVRYAASLQISAVEAGRLMQEAIRAQTDQTPEDEAPDLRLRPDASSGRGWPIWAKLGTALAVVLLVKFTVSTLLGG
ncbi:MAG: hypothetical protein IID40_05950 [Planctomycetes bacterium]|nr:hypothetical protein [Planctomycetota bacterium]